METKPIQKPQQFVSVAIVWLLCMASDVLATDAYRWLEAYDATQALANRIPPPDGYRRVDVPAGCFGHWLRHLPLKQGRPVVRLFNGAEKPLQSAHFAVINIDVGKRDLQQCADAVMRLRAEYLYAGGDYGRIAFRMTNGSRASFQQWADGFRPTVEGNEIRWRRSQPPDERYRGFRQYLNFVFGYAGSYSLSQELAPVGDARDIQIGDVFIEGGFPGHAVIVVDLAVEERTGKRVFLLAQSYMPAQDVHLLQNPNTLQLNPWFPADFGERLYTPEWVFNHAHLKRFPSKFPKPVE